MIIKLLSHVVIRHVWIFDCIKDISLGKYKSPIISELLLFIAIYSQLGCLISRLFDFLQEFRESKLLDLTVISY